MKKDIDCLKDLTAAQLQSLRVWIENLGYRKAVERASEEFKRPIHKAALQRFIWRTAPADFLENTPDNDEATRQILKFAADGKADFTASTVGTLEQLAFQLSLTCTAIDDDMNALAKLSTMLSRFRNSAVRERMAVVQEGKLKLRQQQFEKGGNHDVDSKVQELSAKVSAAFRQHPLLTTLRNAANPTPNLFPSSSAPPFETSSQNDPINTGIHAGDQTRPCAPTVSTVSAAAAPNSQSAVASPARSRDPQCFGVPSKKLPLELFGLQ
jgi:hypothetical protein